jgi:hypothetical protein
VPLAQQFRCGLVFVGLRIDTDLGQDRLDGGRVGGDEVLAGDIAGTTAAQGLAVE